MPSESQSQHRLMELCLHEPAHAKGKCPDPHVAREFVGADKGRDIKALPQKVKKK